MTPGIFIAFEESADHILANAESFGWRTAEQQSTQKLFFLDAQLKPDMVQSKSQPHGFPTTLYPSIR